VFFVAIGLLVEPVPLVAAMPRWGLRGELIIIPSSVAASPRRDVLIIFREIHLRDETWRQYTADFSIQEADFFPNDFYINVTLVGEVTRIGYAAVILQIVDDDKFRELLEKSRDQ
jgi:hypothetical protein